MWLACLLFWVALPAALRCDNTPTHGGSRACDLNPAGAMQTPQGTSLCDGLWTLHAPSTSTYTVQAPRGLSVDTRHRTHENGKHSDTDDADNDNDNNNDNDNADPHVVLQPVPGVYHGITVSWRPSRVHAHCRALVRAGSSWESPLLPKPECHAANTFCVAHHQFPVVANLEVVVLPDSACDIRRIVLESQVCGPLPPDRPRDWEFHNCTASGCAPACARGFIGRPRAVCAEGGRWRFLGSCQWGGTPHRGLTWAAHSMRSCVAGPAEGGHGYVPDRPVTQDFGNLTLPRCSERCLNDTACVAVEWPSAAPDTQPAPCLGLYGCARLSPRPEVTVFRLEPEPRRTCDSPVRVRIGPSPASPVKRLPRSSVPPGVSCPAYCGRDCRANPDFVLSAAEFSVREGAQSLTIERQVTCTPPPLPRPEPPEPVSVRPHHRLWQATPHPHRPWGASARDGGDRRRVCCGCSLRSDNGPGAEECNGEQWYRRCTPPPPQPPKTPPGVFNPRSRIRPTLCGQVGPACAAQRGGDP